MASEPRPGAHQYQMALAVEVASRSNCVKLHVGAILVFGGRIRAVGFNGTLPGYSNCFDGGCDRCRNLNITGGEQLDRCVCVHGEENALASAARYGISVEGCDCYVTHQPCIGCTKLLIQAGVKRVWYLEEYVYEVDAGIDRNTSRKQLVVHAGRRRGGTTFVQYKPAKGKAEVVAREWSDRLDQMKQEAKAHCERRGKLIKKSVVKRIRKAVAAKATSRASSPSPRVARRGSGRQTSPGRSRRPSTA